MGFPFDGRLDYGGKDRNQKYTLYEALRDETQRKPSIRRDKYFTSLLPSISTKDEWLFLTHPLECLQIPIK